MGQFADSPSCCKCGAKAPLNRPEYVYHEGHYHSPNIGEHIHLCCRRCNYKWTMAPADTTGTKWYDKPPLGRSGGINKVGSITDSLGRLLMPRMSSYQENSERFEEEDESPSRKIGWRKPEGLFNVD